MAFNRRHRLRKAAKEAGMREPEPTKAQMAVIEEVVRFGPMHRVVSLDRLTCLGMGWIELAVKSGRHVVPMSRHDDDGLGPNEMITPGYVLTSLGRQVLAEAREREADHG